MLSPVKVLNFKCSIQLPSRQKFSFRVKAPLTLYDIPTLWCYIHTDKFYVDQLVLQREIYLFKVWPHEMAFPFFNTTHNEQ